MPDKNWREAFSLDDLNRMYEEAMAFDPMTPQMPSSLDSLVQAAQAKRMNRPELNA